MNKHLNNSAWLFSVFGILTVLVCAGTIPFFIERGAVWYVVISVIGTLCGMILTSQGFYLAWYEKHFNNQNRRKVKRDEPEK